MELALLQGNAVAFLFRWIHLLAGVAWIGASFYFNWLNDQLTEPETAEPHLEGELWSVHGGAFYRAMKYRSVPTATLSRLHWFKWEAYMTWVSGMVLLVIVFYMNAQTYMLNPAAPGITAGVAVGIGIRSEEHTSELQSH